MKRKVLVVMISLFITVFLGFSSAGAWTISIEPVGTVTNPGDSFMTYVYFNPDPGGNLLDAYNFGLAYDTTELTWDSTNAGAQNTPPPPLQALMGDPYEDPAGTIQNFHGLTFGEGPTLTEKTQLAAVTFFANPGSSDGLDVWMGGTGTGFHIDGNNYDLGSTLDSHIVQGPDVAAVPIPSTMLLFLSGLVGTGISLRRKVV